MGLQKTNLQKSAWNPPPPPFFLNVIYMHRSTIRNRLKDFPIVYLYRSFRKLHFFRPQLEVKSQKTSSITLTRNIKNQLFHQKKIQWKIKKQCIYSPFRKTLLKPSFTLDHLGKVLWNGRYMGDLSIFNAYRFGCNRMYNKYNNFNHPYGNIDTFFPYLYRGNKSIRTENLKMY